jgi:hypothetical protein
MTADNNHGQSRYSQHFASLLAGSVRQHKSCWYGRHGPVGLPGYKVQNDKLHLQCNNKAALQP